MKRPIALLLLAAAFAAPVPARAHLSVSPPMTLARAIALALRGHPDINAARRELDALGGDAVQAAQRPNPTLELLQEGRRRADNPNSATVVQLSVPIELGNKRQARRAVADLDRELGMQLLALTQARVRADTVAAFTAVALADERLRLADGARAIAAAASHAAARRVVAGTVSPVEETRAAVAAATVALDGVQAQRDRQLALLALRALLPADAAPFDGVEAAALAALPVLPSLADLLARLDQAPALAQARLEVARRAALSRVELARRLPDLTVTVGARRDGAEGHGQALVGLAVPLPLLDRNHGAVLSSLRRLDKAREQQAAVAIALRRDLEQAHLRLASALAQVAVIDTTILPGALSAHGAAARGFDAGKFSALDVLDAQRTLNEAHGLRLNARADAHRAAAELAVALPPLETP